MWVGMEVEEKNELVQIMCVLGRRPNASLEQIAEELGKTRMTLYRHYGSRAKLIKLLILESNCMVQAVLSEAKNHGAAQENSSKNAEEVFRYAVERLVPLGSYFKFLDYLPWRFEDAEISSNCAKLLEELEQLVLPLEQSGFLRSDVPPHWNVRVFEGLLFTAWNGLNEGDIAPNMAANFVLQTFYSGVRA